MYNGNVAAACQASNYDFTVKTVLNTRSQEELDEARRASNRRSARRSRNRKRKEFDELRMKCSLLSQLNELLQRQAELLREENDIAKLTIKRLQEKTESSTYDAPTRINARDRQVAQQQQGLVEHRDQGVTSDQDVASSSDESAILSALDDLDDTLMQDEKGDSATWDDIVNALTPIAIEDPTHNSEAQLKSSRSRSPSEDSESGSGNDGIHRQSTQGILQAIFDHSSQALLENSSRTTKKTIFNPDKLDGKMSPQALWRSLLSPNNSVDPSFDLAGPTTKRARTA